MWTPASEPSKKHPIEDLKSAIQESGLVVIDNIKYVPGGAEGYTSSFMTICICHRGWLLGEYDTLKVEFRAKEVAAIFPHHMLRGIEVSPDYEATLIVLSEDVFEKMNQRISFRYQFFYQRSPAFPLSDEQYASMTDIVNLMRTISRYETKDRLAMLANLLEAFSLLCDYYRFPEGIPDESELPAGEYLFTRYYDAIEKYHAKTREVAFYASLFNLTPKYFSSLIKRETGIAAGDWISNYIVIQAKSMLRNRTDLTIQQIGLKLGFTDQAAFSRYIKTNTGTSPREYRDQWG